MFNKVTTISFEEKLIHQNSKPMLFLCDDFNRYYCKSNLDGSHYDFLIYEIIGSSLAKYFSISSPEFALVTFDFDSLGENYPVYNYDLEQGQFFFGSKHIGKYDI